MMYQTASIRSAREDTWASQTPVLTLPPQLEQRTVGDLKKLIEGPTPDREPKNLSVSVICRMLSSLFTSSQPSTTILTISDSTGELEVPFSDEQPHGSRFKWRSSRGSLQSIQADPKVWEKYFRVIVEVSLPRSNPGSSNGPLHKAKQFRPEQNHKMKALVQGLAISEVEITSPAIAQLLELFVKPKPSKTRKLAQAPMQEPALAPALAPAPIPAPNPSPSPVPPEIQINQSLPTTAPLLPQPPSPTQPAPASPSKLSAVSTIPIQQELFTQQEQDDSNFISALEEFCALSRKSRKSHKSPGKSKNKSKGEQSKLDLNETESVQTKEPLRGILTAYSSSSHSSSPYNEIKNLVRESPSSDEVEPPRQEVPVQENTSEGESIESCSSNSEIFHPPKLVRRSHSHSQLDLRSQNEAEIIPMAQNTLIDEEMTSQSVAQAPSSAAEPKTPQNIAPGGHQDSLPQNRPVGEQAPPHPHGQSSPHRSRQNKDLIQQDPPQAPPVPPAAPSHPQPERWQTVKQPPQLSFSERLQKQNKDFNLAKRRVGAKWPEPPSTLSLLLDNSDSSSQEEILSPSFGKRADEADQQHPPSDPPKDAQAGTAAQPTEEELAQPAPSQCSPTPLSPENYERPFSDLSRYDKFKRKEAFLKTKQARSWKTLLLSVIRTIVKQRMQEGLPPTVDRHALKQTLAPKIPTGYFDWLFDSVWLAEFTEKLERGVENLRIKRIQSGFRQQQQNGDRI